MLLKVSSMYHNDDELLDMLREVVEAFAPPIEQHDSTQSVSVKAWNTRWKVKEALIKLIKDVDK